MTECQPALWLPWHHTQQTSEMEAQAPLVGSPMVWNAVRGQTGTRHVAHTAATCSARSVGLCQRTFGRCSYHEPLVALQDAGQDAEILADGVVVRGS